MGDHGDVVFQLSIPHSLQSVLVHRIGTGWVFYFHCGMDCEPRMQKPLAAE
jgi:hypothetical protein